MNTISEIKVSYTNPNKDSHCITKSEDAYKVLLAHWNMDIIEFQEEVKVLLLNRANKVLGVYELSKGGVSQATVDIKIILSVALKCHASGLILAHNHPSENIKPSFVDLSITKKLRRACKHLDLTLLDHLIISKTEFYSFSDEGKLQ